MTRTRAMLIAGLLAGSLAVTACQNTRAKDEVLIDDLEAELDAREAEAEETADEAPVIE